MEQTTKARPQGDKPLVSVAIPCYNAAATLAQTLDCVLAQSYPALEIIVVDDGSTDASAQLLERYAARVRVLRQPNGGLASARNAGCRAARGEYIALLDSDDLCHPERIAMQVAYLELRPELVMCSSDFAAFNASGPVAQAYAAHYYSRLGQNPRGAAGIYPLHEELTLAGEPVSTYSGYVYQEMALGNFMHPPTVMFRRSVLKECGLLDEGIVNCCDFEWFVRMSRSGKAGFIDRPLLNYRLSESQMSGPRNRLQMALDVVQVIEKTLRADPQLMQRKPRLFRAYLGSAYLNAAEKLADHRPLAAAARLARSLACGVLGLRSVKVLCKIFTPAPLIAWRRGRQPAAGKAGGAGSPRQDNARTGAECSTK